MDTNNNCMACKIKADEDKYKTWRTVCKVWYMKKKRKYISKNNHPITMKMLCMNPITTELSS